MTTVFGSLDLGSVVGLLVCGPLIHAFGWPSVFYLFAVLGLLWCLLWPLLKPDQADPDVPAPPPSSAPSVAGMLTLLLILGSVLPTHAPFEEHPWMPMHQQHPPHTDQCHFLSLM